MSTCKLVHTIHTRSLLEARHAYIALSLVAEFHSDTSATMALLTVAGSSYSFKLRNSIEEEADSALSRLDDLIKTKGYEWLNDYMQGVKEAVAQGGRRNAAQAG